MARAWDPQATDDARSRSDHTTADMDESTTYIAVMEDVWSVIDLYASRPDDRNPFDDADECPVQWPIPRNAQKKKTVHYCRCKVEWTINAEDPAWVRCGDTACIKSAGWHHKSCLTENEHDNLEQHPYWICDDCIKYRLTNGYPELTSGSLQADRRRQLQEKVVAWDQAKTAARGARRVETEKAAD